MHLGSFEFLHLSTVILQHVLRAFRNSFILQTPVDVLPCAINFTARIIKTDITKRSISKNNPRQLARRTTMTQGSAPLTLISTQIPWEHAKPTPVCVLRVLVHAAVGMASLEFLAGRQAGDSGRNQCCRFQAGFLLQETSVLACMQGLPTDWRMPSHAAEGNLPFGRSADGSCQSSTFTASTGLLFD